MDKRLLSIIQCPNCGSELELLGPGLGCSQCRKTYNIVEGVPVLVDLDMLDAHLAGQVRYFERDTAARGTYKLEAWQESYLERFKENFTPAAGDLVVDLGTGTGYMAVELARLGCECIACDLTLGSLLRLRSVLFEHGLQERVHLVCCDAERLPLRPGIARYLMSNAVLEHLSNDLSAAREIDRVCAREAALMVTAPLAYRYLNPLFIPLNWIHDMRIGHLRRYDELILAELFDGWELMRTYYPGHFSKVTRTIINVVTHVFDEQAVESADRSRENVRNGASNIICFFARAQGRAGRTRGIVSGPAMAAL